MLVYYKKKERDDLARIDYYNEVLKDAAKELQAVSTHFGRKDWLEVLSGAVTFKEALVNAYMVQHSKKADLEAPNMVYGECCPESVQKVGELLSIRLEDVRFRYDAISFSANSTPQLSPALIKSLYPRWYTVEVAELTKEQVEARKKLAAKFTNMSFPKPDSPEEIAELARLDQKIDFGPGYRRTLEKGKVKVIFSEAAYYEDMAQRKLNL